MLLKNTRIACKNGNKFIQDIIIGDLVLSFNIHSQKKRIQKSI